LRQWSKTSGTSRWAIRRQKDGSIPETELEGINLWRITNDAVAEHRYYTQMKDDSDPTGIRQHPLGDLVYRLLDPKIEQSWKAFATTKYQKTGPAWTDYINIEYIHNNLHVSLVLTT
jgi:hypothetical protein